MSEGVVREVLSGRGGGALAGGAAGTLGAGGAGWGGGWGGGDSREWLAIAATAPLPLLGLSWALLVSRLHRRYWKPVDVFVAALLSAGIAKQALTLAFALLSLLLLPPDARAGASDAAEGDSMLGPVDAQNQPVASGLADGGWSWDSSGGVMMSAGGGGTREEALCSAAVWGLTSAHALQAAALASLAADRALLALGSRPRRFRAAQARYHVCVLAVVSALVGAAGVFARGGTVPPLASEDDDPCLFLPHQLDTRFALFWICLHGGLLLAGAALVVMVTARICCCLPRRSWRRGAAAASSTEDDSGCCEDEEPLPVPSPCDTSTAASTASTTASGRCGSTAALYAAASAAPTNGNKCACSGGGTDVSMAFRWTEPPSRGQDLRTELRWSMVVSLMALYYILNHVPVLAVTVLGTFAPWLLPHRWPLGTVVLWAGLAQDALLPLVLAMADSRFAGWAKRVYSGAAPSSPSSSSTPSSTADELRRQHHQHQQQLRQQQLEQRRREQQQHLLHQQLQQQLQERRRRLEMTLDSPLPTARADHHEPAYAVAPLSSAKGGGAKIREVMDVGKGPFLLAPPWKQKNSISVESLFTSKSDLSQQMSPPYSHQTLTSTSVPSSGLGSTPNTSTVGSGTGRDPQMKFPLTNGSLFTVGADGRYPVVRNYRRGSNGGLQSGRIGLQMVTNPRCDANMLPLSAMRPAGGGLTNIEGDITMSNNETNNHLSNMSNHHVGGNFGCHSGPRGRPVPIVAPSETVINRLEASDSDLDEEPIYATLSSLEEDCEEEADDDGEDEEDDDDEEDDEDEEDEDGRAASPMSSCSVTTAANDDFEYRDAKGGGGAMVTSALDGSNFRKPGNDASNGEEDEEDAIEEVVFRLPERNVPSALGLYRLRLDELAVEASSKEEEGERAASDLPEGSSLAGGALIRSPHNFHRRRYRRMPAHHHHPSRRLGVVLSVDSLQTALSRPDAVAYLDNGDRMSGSVPDFKKVFVSEFI